MAFSARVKKNAVDIEPKIVIIMAVAIDTNSLVALRATKLLLTPTQSRDYNIILITAQYR